jgi:hypothetical protein
MPPFTVEIAASLTLRLLLGAKLNGRTHPEAVPIKSALQLFVQCRVDRSAARGVSGRRETVVALAHCSTIRHVGGVLLAVSTLCLAGAPQPASAQGLFQALFGNVFHRRAPESPPPQASSYADPLGLFGEDRRPGSESGYGSGIVFCVRTCDGRYFPLPHHPGASSADLCRSFCPAAKTMMFSGSKIETAVAQNGTRYADLDHAFAYRDKVSDQCSCNGKDGLGLARVETSGDPTLRPGDIVATASGLATYNGKSRTAEFTPISTSSSEWARRLAEVKIEPAPPGEKIEPVVNDDTRPAKGRGQATR